MTPKTPTPPLSRRTLAVAAALTMLAIVGSLLAGTRPATAGGGTVSGTDGSGAAYAMTVTCATRSATLRVGLSAANGYAGSILRDDRGNSAAIQPTTDGTPTTVGPAAWTVARHLPSAADAYSATDAAAAPVIGAVATMDCPRSYGPGARFVPLTPQRLLDTRPTSAIGYSGPKPSAGAVVPVRIAGRAGIPAGVVAVALNVTMTDTSQPGFAQVYPTGGPSPGSSSNVNADSTGQTIPNAVITPVGADGTISVFTSGGTHLLVDISGYFLTAAAPVAAGRFVSVTPRRLLDTRPESPIGYSGPKPGVGSIVRVGIAAALGHARADIAAVAVNITATDATQPGFVQAAPAGALVPGASSNLNVVRAGQTIPNLAIVPVGDDGAIDILTSGGTHVLVDVLGWFTTATATPSASGLFIPVTPERVLDTRPASAVNAVAEQRPDGSQPTKPGRASALDVHFDGLVPIEPAAVILNVTATEAIAAGYVQTAAAGQLSPGASSTVNVERAGQTIANAALVPLSPDHGATLYTQSGTHLLADVAGYFRT